MGVGMGQHGLETINVLVVDDDEVVRLAVKTIVSALGAAGVAEATDGARAIETLGRFPADIVICDWNMAPMSGIEFLRQIRGAGGSPDRDVPIIMLTSDTDMDRVIEARDSGATSFLAKPVTVRGLSEKIFSVLQDGGGQPSRPAAGGTDAAVDESSYWEIRERVKGTNINEQALLATDYLNHFNEVAMLLEMTPGMPEILDRAKEWKPKSYAQHFRDSGLSDVDLIIEAYEHSPAKYRKPFDETVAQLNRMVVEAIRDIEAAITNGDRNRVETVAANSVAALRESMEKANGIIHGSVPTMDQDAIDALFD